MLIIKYSQKRRADDNRRIDQPINGKPHRTVFAEVGCGLDDSDDDFLCSSSIVTLHNKTLHLKYSIDANTKYNKQTNVPEQVSKISF